MSVAGEIMDIVIPNNNEDAFIAIAEKLGTKELLFLYSFDSFKASKNSGIVCSGKEVKNAKKKTQYVFVKADANVRKIAEQKPYAIVGFETLEKKDSLHYRRSGIDQVLAKIMAEHKIAYAFSFSDLLNAPSYMQPIILGRLRQNLMIAKKYGMKVIIASFATEPLLMRSEKDMWCLG
jgi:hypothetical protein